MESDREGFAETMNRDQGFAQRLMSADAVRTERLKVIVRQHGWPNAAQIGRDGVDAAWLLLQHSPDHDFQAQMLPMIERSAEGGDLGWMAVANLTDRVLVQSGRPQRYGQSFELVDGTMVAHPIEDPGRLEERRAARGLPPMADYAKALSELMGVPVRWP